MSEKGLFENVATVFSYTRKQAIEDGVLIDLMQGDMKPVCEQYYKVPIACTSGVWGIIDRAVASKEHCNDILGVLHDIMFMSRVHNRPLNDSTVSFEVIITGAGENNTYTLIMSIGPGDEAEPVATIMLPGED